MFYNTYRSTKAAMREAQQNKLSGAGQYIVNPHERLINLQKREKLKGLLITKFMKKYGINHPEKILEDEINKFLQGEKLNDADLQRLDAKIRRLLMEKKNNQSLKNTLTNDPNSNTLGATNLPNDYNNTLQSQQAQESIYNTVNSNTLNQSVPPQSNTTTLKSTAPLKQTKQYGKYKYKSPEEELAELEAEEAEYQRTHAPKEKKIDFSAMGDQWNAMAQFNKMMYEQELLDEKFKQEEIKRRVKEELDGQIKERLKREYEDELKNKEYDRIMREHAAKMLEIEKKKEQELAAQVEKERKLREAQIKDQAIRRRIEELKDKKYERRLVETIQKELAIEKKQQEELKKLQHESFLKTMKENELHRKKLEEMAKKEREDDIKSQEEAAKIEEKKELERKLYFKRIERNANNFMTGVAKEALEKMKREEKEEEEKMRLYNEEKNRREILKEKRMEEQREKDKHELHKYLAMQIEERKKNEELENILNQEQARIWRIDANKYKEDERIIEEKIKRMNKKNLETLMKQMEQRRLKEQKEAGMTPTEIAMNKKELEKVALAAQK